MNASTKSHSLLGQRFILWLCVVMIFAMAARTAVDSDLWWHLRAGEATWTSRTVTLHDAFSYTRAGQAWVNHSWLAQVGMYLAYRQGGFFALSALMAGLAAASMALAFLQMEGPPILKAFILVLAALVAALVWTPRPQTASLAFFALVGYLLYLYKWKGNDRLWLLLPLFALWSNLHGGYVLGFILIACLLAGEALNHLLGFTPAEETLAWRRILRLAAWTVAAGLAALANPNGIQTWLIPFKTVGVNALQNLISEWASPDFHQLVQQPFIWLLLAVLAAVGLSGRRLDGSDLVTLGAFAYLALVARRNYGPFALAAAPVLSRHLWPALQAWSERVYPPLARLLGRTMYGEARRLNLVQIGVILLLVLVSGAKLATVNAPAVVTPAVEAAYPTGAVAWIEEHHPPGRLFNSYNWGGYLMWELRDYPVFVDGRTDLYNDEIIGQWVQAANGAEGWEAVLDRWEVRLVLLEPDRPLARLLPDAGWDQLYADNVAVLYGR